MRVRALVLNRVLTMSRWRFHTVLSYFWARWWGVQLGRQCRFYGMPIFSCHPKGNISIGRGCVFRSAEWSNSIGLNRRTNLSASRDATVKIGEDCGFSGTAIAAARSIVIGNRVQCGANCTICDSDRHPLDHFARAKCLPVEGDPVEIGDDVWLAMNVVVLKGVSVGARTVAAANSVLVKSVPEDVLVAGCPATVIRSLLPTVRSRA
jgi:acetyltransferase-like isoleucine patch superfamily enzyme